MSIFLFNKVLIETDVSFYDNIRFIEKAPKFYLDARTDSWTNPWTKPDECQVYIYEATYKDGPKVKFWMVANDYKEQKTATDVAVYYAKMLGQIPKIIRQGVLRHSEKGRIGPLVIIISAYSKTKQRPGGTWHGGNVPNLIGPFIHIGTDSPYSRNHNLAYLTLLHEGGHACLDWEYYQGLYEEEWNNAVANDNNRFITRYAKDNPRREDVAECFTIYVVLKYLNNRIPKEQYNKLMETIPNRLQVFDNVIPEDKMAPMSVSNYPAINYENDESQNKLVIIIPSVVGSFVLISVIIFLVLKYRYRKF